LSPSYCINPSNSFARDPKRADYVRYIDSTLAVSRKFLVQSRRKDLTHDRERGGNGPLSDVFPLPPNSYLPFLQFFRLLHRAPAIDGESRIGHGPLNVDGDSNPGEAAPFLLAVYKKSPYSVWRKARTRTQSGISMLSKSGSGEQGTGSPSPQSLLRAQAIHPSGAMIRMSDCHWSLLLGLPKSGDDSSPAAVVLKSFGGDRFPQGGAMTLFGRSPATLENPRGWASFCRPGTFDVT